MENLAGESVNNFDAFVDDPVDGVIRSFRTGLTGRVGLGGNERMNGRSEIERANRVMSQHCLLPYRLRELENASVGEYLI